jgi:hypothetical protein
VRRPGVARARVLTRRAGARAQVDVDLAKQMARMPIDDEGLSRKLWLRIARHIIEADGSVKGALELIEECGVLRIEDLLPYFPDFVVINQFKVRG